MRNTASQRQTSTNPYGMPLPILIPATEAQRKARQYDGVANFQNRPAPPGLQLPELPVILFGSNDRTPGLSDKFFFAGEHLPVVILGGQYLPDRECLAEAAKWDDFVALTQLRDAHETADEYATDKATDKLFASEPHGKIIAHLWKRVPARKRVPFVLPKEFSERIDSARLVLWWNWKLKQFQPAVFCGNLRTAMFVRAALRDLRACPSCDKPFRPERPDQEYCSIACRERFRQRRRRADQQGKGRPRKVKRHGHL